MEKISSIVVLALLVAGCSHPLGKQYDSSPIRVNTMVVGEQSNALVMRYVGTVEPLHEVPLSMQSTGRVVAVNVREGDRVVSGQKLIEIDNTQAMHTLRAAEATYQHALDGYQRVRQVHSKGVVSDQKMVEIESQYHQAQAMYEAAKQRVNECILVAPTSGIISGMQAEVGQTVIPGTRLCAILDVTGFRVSFTVPEAEVGTLAETGEMECPALDTVLPIRISQKSVIANSLTHTYEVKARIQGGEDMLVAGMVGKIRTKGQCNNIVIPARCVLLKPQGPTVWVYSDGYAVRRNIVVDGYQADGVHITNGLYPGDTLIIDGYQKLYEGCRVEW